MHLSPDNLLTHAVNVLSALSSYHIYTQSSTECIHHSIHSSFVGKIDYNKVFVFFVTDIQKGRNFSFLDIPSIKNKYFNE